jgi:hypothetical protein
VAERLALAVLEDLDKGCQQAKQERNMSEITYGVTRLETGRRRWAVTRNGQPVLVKRTQAGAEKQAHMFGEFLAITGRESYLLEVALKHPSVYGVAE